MANLVSDAYMASLLKTVYLSGVANNKSQNSPVVSKIKKDTFVGKEMKYATQYANGGNFGANYTDLLNNKRLGARNGEWSMTPGHLTGLFKISQPEILQSDSDKAAYMKIIANKMSACFDGLSKTLAIYFYGGKWAVIDTVKENVSVTTGIEFSLPMTSSGSIKLDLGTKVEFASVGEANKAVPSSAIVGSAIVKEIDDYNVTFESPDFTGTLYAGDYIELAGNRKGGESLAMEGLEDFIPTLANRDKADARWSTYIATTFRGMDRSEAVNRLAGQFVVADKSGTSKTPLTDALAKLLKKTKRQGGGVNNVLIINDEDYEKVQKEADLTRNFVTNTSDAKGKKNATFGLSDFSVVFGEAGFNEVIIDPYCPEGKAYSLDLSDLDFFDLGNMGRLVAPTSNDQIGKYDIESVGDQGIGNDPKVSLNTDKLFTVTQAESDEFGPTFTIAAHLFGNFCLKKTSSSGVAIL